MKNRLLLLVAVGIFLSVNSFGQTVAPSSFHGAAADLKSYKAVYVLNQSDDKKIRAVLRNMNNALDDPRLKGKLKVELVAFGDGLDIFKKANPYDTLLTNLQKKGALLAACENTIRERKIDKADLWNFISFVPSGNGEIIIRQQQGWASIHP